MKSKYYVLILNFKNKEDSFTCLELLKDLKELNVVFIDNASMDGSVEAVKKKFPRVAIIKNKDNLGFAGGNNKGIRYALDNGAIKILLLNNDTLFSANDVKILLESEGDIVGPILEFHRNCKTIYDLGGHINWWTGRTVHEETEFVTKIDHRNPDYVSGAAMLIRREVFEKIGLLDESYFLYYEDADFCSRARRAGFNVSIEPRVVIHHKLGGSGGRLSRSTLYHNLRSNLFFINKNIIWWRRPVGLLYLMLITSKVTLNLFLSRQSIK